MPPVPRAEPGAEPAAGAHESAGPSLPRRVLRFSAWYALWSLLLWSAAVTLLLSKDNLQAFRYMGF